VYDLLRGLMLPSGNDAAMCLAENFGARIMLTKRPGEFIKKGSGLMTDEMGKKHIACFVREMNRVAVVMNLKNTEFTNPHGLSSKANHSSALELAKLAAYGMKYSRDFFTLVNTKVHNAVTYLPLERASKVLKIHELDLKKYVTKAPFQTTEPSL